MKILAEASAEQLGQLLGFVVFGGAIVFFLVSRIMGGGKQRSDDTEE